MERIYIAIIAFAVIATLSLDTSAQGARNGASNGYQNTRANGAQNGVSNGYQNGQKGTTNGLPNGVSSASDAGSEIVMKGSRNVYYAGSANGVFGKLPTTIRSKARR
ncbi:MAG TPA: hypothetical protein VNA22_05040 [Pyrinomonadaceae bacterium]|nr:hypothetical protein [Pyrinomonadaceae bacterium]